MTEVSLQIPQPAGFIQTTKSIFFIQTDEFFIVKHFNNIGIRY